MYLRPDEMHTAFNFEYLNCTWDPKALRHVIDATLDAHAPVPAALEWLPTDPELLSFTPPGGFTFLANLSDQPVPLHRPPTSCSPAAPSPPASSPRTPRPGS
jgi:hypothetical protein